MARVLSIDAIGAVIDIDGLALPMKRGPPPRLPGRMRWIEPPGASCFRRDRHGAWHGPRAGDAGRVVHGRDPRRVGRPCRRSADAARRGACNPHRVVSWSLSGHPGAARQPLHECSAGCSATSQTSPIGIAADGNVVPYRKPLSLIELNPHLKVQGRIPQNWACLAFSVCATAPRSARAARAE